MGKISIYVEDRLVNGLDALVREHPNINKRNRSALINYLVEQEIAKQNRKSMLEAAAAAAVDELDLGWSQEEEYCAITDTEASG